jgi:predicted ATP-grasp superfamily ATP-dependent carboligase
VTSADRPFILVAALSGRALAELARKTGYRPLVADLFGDTDTRRIADAVRVVRGTLFDGFDPDDLVTALAELTRNATAPPIGLVCGSGFEQNPAMLDRLAEQWSLLGCDGATVERAKDPSLLAQLCETLGIPHPEIRFDRPDEPQGWLAKHVGGGGGWHISDASVCAPRTGVYFQKRVGGTPVSALVVGTGTAASLIGWSSQWAEPALDAPYRWAGAVQPAALAPDLGALLSRNAVELAVAAKVVGLASLDFLFDDRAWHLLEINPRPGSTLDIFDEGSGALFAMHVAACRGDLIAPPRKTHAQACVIAFAERDIACMPAIDWPDWCADLQAPGTHVEAESPVCTIRAAAADAEAARRLVEERRRALLDVVHERELAAC